MDNTVPTAQQLARYFLTAQHPSTRSWVDDTVRLRLLTEQRADDVLLASDMEVAAVRSKRFAPEHSPELMLNRWAAAGDDLHAMLSMRYEGGDPSKPFVDATVTSRPFTIKDLPKLAGAADRTFGILNPGYLRLWSSAAAGYFAGTTQDKRFLAAQIRTLRDHPGRALPPELSLRVADSLDHYELACGAYADVDREHPAHVGQAQPPERQDLERALQKQDLFDITLAGDWAGYVAVTDKGGTLGLPGYIVLELIMVTKARGRGYGSLLTTLLARVLPDDGRVLIGTVHADNRGARRAAEAAGRVDVGGWIRVPLRTSEG